MNKNSGRAILLGLDSLDLNLARRWASEGVMPNFAALLSRSVEAILTETSTSPLPAGVWQTLLTGVSPGTHGFVDGDRYREKPPDPTLVAGRLYKTLSERNVRCAVVDASFDTVIRPFNGVHVVDWAVENWLWGFQTEPRSWREHLEGTYGRHPLTKNPRVQIDTAGLLRLRQDLERGLALKLELCLDLLEDEYSFLLLNFAELHKAGHYFWRFHEPTHPDYDASEPALASALRDLHAQMDAALGQILGRLKDDDHLFLISDRGMEHNHRAHHLLEEVLVRLKAIERREALPGKGGARAEKATLLAKDKLRSLVRRALPNGLRQVLVPWYRLLIGEQAPTNARTTRVFYEPSVGNSFVRVNLKGRELHGTVAPGREYDELLAWLEHELYALTNPASAQRVVEKIYYPWRTYQGPKRDELPDLSIVWNAAAKVDAVESPSIGVVTQDWKDRRSGNHADIAFMLCSGPAFTSVPRRIEVDARQLAPTVMRLLGQDIPAQYELGPLDDLRMPSAA